MRKILAVARVTLLSALRMKIAAAVILLLLILLPVMSVIMDGDGTLLGKLQTLASYGLSLIGILLCILTIAVSAYTLSQDLRRKHIFLVASKPIRRWQIICGKLAGVVLLDALLLAAFAGVLYGLVYIVARKADVPQEQRQQVRDEFFIARFAIAAKTDEAEITKSVQQQYLKLKQAGQLPEGMTQTRILSELAGQERLRRQSVEVGSDRIWEFSGVRVADPNGRIFVRFKYETSATPPDEKVYGLWSIGDLRQLKQGFGGMQTPIYNVRQADTVRAFHEVSVPADAVAADGFLGVGFLNSPSLNQTTVMPLEMEILYRVGGFGANYWRSVLLIFVRLVFLAAMGVALTTWMSFPVAMFACVVVFLAGTINGFIAESIDSLDPAAWMVYRLTLKPLLSLLPRFDGPYSPTKYIVSARVLSWWFLAEAAVFTIAVKGLLLTLTGMFIFRYRQVAKSEI